MGFSRQMRLWIAKCNSGDYKPNIIIAEVLNTKTSFVNIPFPIAAFVVNMLYFISFKKFDYREKLDRLTEDRAYSHIDIQTELGYSPVSFKDRLRQTIDTYNDYV